MLYVFSFRVDMNWFCQKYVLFIGRMFKAFKSRSWNIYIGYDFLRWKIKQIFQTETKRALVKYIPYIYSITHLQKETSTKYIVDVTALYRITFSVASTRLARLLATSKRRLLPHEHIESSKNTKKFHSLGGRFLLQKLRHFWKMTYFSVMRLKNMHDGGRKNWKTEWNACKYTISVGLSQRLFLPSILSNSAQWDMDIFGYASISIG